MAVWCLTRINSCISCLSGNLVGKCGLWIFQGQRIGPVLLSFHLTPLLYAHWRKWHVRDRLEKNCQVAQGTDRECLNIHWVYLLGPHLHGSTRSTMGKWYCLDMVNLENKASSLVFGKIPFCSPCHNSWWVNIFQVDLRVFSLNLITVSVGNQ